MISKIKKELKNNREIISSKININKKILLKLIKLRKLILNNIEQNYNIYFNYKSINKFNYNNLIIKNE